MTITETRPATDEPAGAEERPARQTADTWLTTGDHKRLGLLLAWAGLAGVLSAMGLAAAFALPAVGDGVDVWTRLGSRVASAVTTTALVVGIPALWLGLLTHIVPLQVGATRLALPRLQALAVWTYWVGGICCGAAYAIGRPLFNLGSLLPPPAGAAPRNSTELLLGGLLLVAAATTMAAVGIIATVLAQRPAGMTMGRFPMFTWTGLATCLGLVLSTPVFAAGLVLLYLDQRYGSAVFAPDSFAGLRVWQHQLWPFGRPEAFLLLAPGLGALSDIVATHARRPLVAFPVARAAAVFATLWSFVAWATPFAGLTTVVPPTPTVATAFIAVPAGVVVLSWLGTLATGSPRVHGSVVFVVGHVLLIGAALVMALVAALVGVEADDAHAFRNGQLTVVVIGGALTAIAASLLHWAPKLSGRVAPTGAALLSFLLIVGGVVVAAAGAYAVGLGADSDVAVALTAGFAMVGAGVLVLVPLVVGRGAGLPPDPYGSGQTLEWAAASPPPRHNFDSLPPITSPHPLYQEGAPA